MADDRHATADDVGAAESRQRAGEQKGGLIMNRKSLALVALGLGVFLAPGVSRAAQGPEPYATAPYAAGVELAGAWQDSRGPIAPTVRAEGEAEREALLTYLNRFQAVDFALGRAVFVHIPRLNEELALWNKGDHERGFFLMTSGIDLMVKGMERILPILHSLESPEALAAPTQGYVQGVDLFFDGTKRLNWGLVRRDENILRDALWDYYGGLQMVMDASAEIKAIAAEYGISQNEETGVWE